MCTTYQFIAVTVLSKLLWSKLNTREILDELTRAKNARSPSTGALLLAQLDLQNSIKKIKTNTFNALTLC